MKLSKSLLVRKIDKNTHILNPYNGKLVTLSSNDFNLLNDYSEEDIDTEILDTIQIPKNQPLKSRNFRSGLIELGAEYKFPTIVNIELTRRCLLDCKHCYITTEEHKSKNIKGIEALEANEIDKLIKDLKNLGVFLIVLTGGEPLISKNVLHFVNACKKNNIILELFSCLQIIPKWLLEDSYPIGRIQVSVYSLEDSIHDMITRKKGSLETTLNNIKILKKKGYYIEIATPLMKLNFTDRNSIKDYFKKLDIPQNFSWPILNEYYSEKTSKSLLNISKEDFLIFSKENPEYIIECKWTNENTPLCEAGIALFSISANGDVFPCSQYPLKVGNIFNQNIKNIYHGKQMKSAISFKYKDLCEDCKYYNFCIGNNYSETGDPLVQPKFMRDILEHSITNTKKKGGKIYEKNPSN